MDVNINNYNLDKICRVCLIEKTGLKPLFDAFVADMLTYCSSLIVYKGDGLPDQICTQCMLQISKSYAFKQLCLKSDTVLRNYINNTNFTNNDSENTCTDKNEIKDTEILDEVFSCSECTSTFKFKVDLEVHKLENHKQNEQTQQKVDSYHSCSVCGKSFKARWELNKHVKLHLENKPFSCNICRKGFLYKSHLLKHAKSHTVGTENEEPAQKPYSCSLCEKEFVESRSLQKHMLVQHSVSKYVPEKKHLCSVCGKKSRMLFGKSRPEGSRFLKHSRLQKSLTVQGIAKIVIYIPNAGTTGFRRSVWRRELASAAIERFRKPSSRKRFLERRYLLIHIRKHTGEKPLSCEICGKTFSNPHCLKSHMTTHSGLKPYKCKICGKAFAWSSVLTQHLRTHSGEKPFVCTVCGKRVSQHSNLILHMRGHTGQRPYVCTVCGKAFAGSSALTVHRRWHTGERPYSCPVCPKSFAQSHELSIHARTHSGARPFPCTACGKAFRTRAHLTAHVRTHTGERPYACPVCPKSFAVKQVLRAHSRTHSGEKPYQCGVCGGRFAHSASLYTHRKVHEEKAASVGYT